MTFTASTSNQVPAVVIDPISHREYTRGKFLGKGGHAVCYEFVDRETNVVYAGKIVRKETLYSSRLKQHMKDEIEIHKSLRHKHIVDFHSHFEDNNCVYIILELCTKQSLLQMLNCRKTLTEVEVRYFVRQLLLACEYLVQERVVHWDLKLANLLLTGDMQLKVADFGRSARVRCEGNSKNGMTSTIDYTGPEILVMKRPSYEEDVWSIGCIIYTLLVGQTPFKSSAQITDNDCHFLSAMSPDAGAIVRWMLQANPAERPSITDVMHHDFMTKGLLPAFLPELCLTTEPELDAFSATPDLSDQETLPEKNEILDT